MYPCFILQLKSIDIVILIQNKIFVDKLNSTLHFRYRDRSVEVIFEKKKKKKHFTSNNNSVKDIPTKTQEALKQILND